MLQSELNEQISEETRLPYNCSYVSLREAQRRMILTRGVRHAVEVDLLMTLLIVLEELGPSPKFIARATIQNFTRQGYPRSQL